MWSSWVARAEHPGQAQRGLSASMLARRRRARWLPPGRLLPVHGGRQGQRSLAGTTARHCGQSRGAALGMASTNGGRRAGGHMMETCASHGCARLETTTMNQRQDRYKIVRFFADPERDREVITRGLTLEQAQAHCNSPETSSSTATSAAALERTGQVGDWFDGYEDDGVSS